MAKDIMAKDHMATAATTARRRLQRLLVHPVGRRPSSNSRRMGRPAAPTGASAGKPGRPRRHQHNKIEIAKKGTCFGSLSHLLTIRGAAQPRNSSGELKGRPERGSVPPRLGSVASQKYRTQTFAFHRAWASREGRFAEENLEGVDLVARKKDAQPIYAAGRKSVRVARRAGRES